MKMLLHIFTGALALAISLPAARAQVAGSLDPAFNPNVPRFDPGLSAPLTTCLCRG